MCFEQNSTNWNSWKKFKHRKRSISVAFDVWKSHYRCIRNMYFTQSHFKMLLETIEFDPTGRNIPSTAAAAAAISRWMHQVYKPHMKYIYCIRSHQNTMRTFQQNCCFGMPKSPHHWNISSSFMIAFSPKSFSSSHSHHHCHRFAWNIYSQCHGYFHFPRFALLLLFSFFLVIAYAYVQDRYGASTGVGGRQRWTDTSKLFLYANVHKNIYSHLVKLVYEIVFGLEKCAEIAFFPNCHKLGERASVCVYLVHQTLATLLCSQCNLNTRHTRSVRENMFVLPRNGSPVSS